MNELIPVVIFLSILFVIELIYYGVTTAKKSEKKKVRDRLKSIGKDSQGEEPVNILRARPLSSIPWFGRALRSMPGIQRLEDLLAKANVNAAPGLFILSCILLGFLGHYLAGLYVAGKVLPFAVGLLMAYFPLFFVQMRKARRMQKFERQLPDALELIARALRAGHAFSSGLKMVAQEFDDPIGTEFERTQDEINYGVSVPEALKNMTQRVECEDLKFFVVAVVIQRDTGGNLAEIIDNMSRVIRERFKLHGKIKILSAEGRLSALVLCLLPFFMALVVYFLNPDLIMTLNEDPMGRVLAVNAMILMALGIVVIRKMVQIRV